MHLSPHPWHGMGNVLQQGCHLSIPQQHGHGHCSTAALLHSMLLSLKAPPTCSMAQRSSLLAVKQQTLSCHSSTESSWHNTRHQGQARQDAVVHAGWAPVSPSIRGNTWAHDRQSQEGLEEAEGQQRFRMSLCSLSRNVAKALIPLELAITLKLFLSTMVSGCTGDNHIRRHHGALTEQKLDSAPLLALSCLPPLQGRDACC